MLPPPSRATQAYPNIVVDLSLSDLYLDRTDVAFLVGRLVEVLSDVISDEEGIHAVYVGGARLPQRVRVFLDFIVPRLQAFLNEEIRTRRSRT